jgi:serine/threonine-protein kinase
MTPPRRIGKYELEQYLGGGMSEVWRARDTVIGRTVAIKILTEKGCADPAVRARFLLEARTAGNLDHDNIIRVYDFGEDENQRPFLVMEFLRGEDLRKAMQEGRAGDLRRRLEIAIQMAGAFEYIHSRKVVHRDIKPENVHLTESGQVKVMDFGVAKTEELSMTRTGFVVGTPYYMAPEQVLGKPLDGRADVYAFGILLYELIAGVRPFTAESVERLFFLILNEPLDAERLRQAGAPEGLCELVLQCTAKEPSGRPGGFAELKQKLRRVLDETGRPKPEAAPMAATLAGAAAAPMRKPSADAPRAAPAPAQSRRMAAMVIGAVVLAGGGIAAYVMTRPEAKPDPDVQPPAAASPPQRISTTTGEMMLVAEGSFLSGRAKEPVTLPAFYIDRTEVTNAAYAEFCKAAGHALPPDFPKDKPGYPVVNVTYADAAAFAQWAGKRLPASREWEKAARGLDGRLFPWGDDADASHANVKTGHVRPAEDFAMGASPFGALQMVGNVWELVNEPAQPTPAILKMFRSQMKPAPTLEDPWYLMRGGSCDEPLQDNVMYDGATVPGAARSANIGFRCVKDP